MKDDSNYKFESAKYQAIKALEDAAKEIARKDVVPKSVKEILEGLKPTGNSYVLSKPQKLLIAAYNDMILEVCGPDKKTDSRSPLQGEWKDKKIYTLFTTAKGKIDEPCMHFYINVEEHSIIDEKPKYFTIKRKGAEFSNIIYKADLNRTYYLSGEDALITGLKKFINYNPTYPLSDDLIINGKIEKSKEIIKKYNLTPAC